MNDLILTPDRRIRVFLSSRLPEFKGERADLVKAIDGMELTALYFEETARPHPAQKVYQKYVAETDIFVGIYGIGYGWIDTEAGMTISGVEDEWRLSNGKPRLVFVQETDEPRDAKLDALLKDIQDSRDVTYCHFSDRVDLVTKVKTALRTHIAERFLAVDRAVSEAQPETAEDVADVLAGYPILVTDYLISNLEPAVKTVQSVFVSGGPGMGKTTALFQLSQRQPRAVYLSLRNQSALSAFLTLNRCLAKMLDQPILPASSAYVAQRNCERMLVAGECLLLIDDIEQVPEFLRIFAGLKLGKSRLVLAGRRCSSEFQGKFTEIQCQGFSLAEVQEYLANANKSSPVEYAGVVDRSKGNPLYLRYYLEAPNGKPALNLEGYHAGMWTRLLAGHREIVALCALSEVPPTLVELAKAVSQYRSSPISPLTLQQELEGLGNIVSVHKATVRIFHPAFREFVAKALRNDGLAEDVHTLLARTFSDRDDDYLRVIHMARAGHASEVSDDLMRVASWAEITGRMQVARLLLAATIRVGRAKGDRKLAGGAMLQAAHVQHSTRNVSSALFAADYATKYLQKSNEEDLVTGAMVTKATFLAEIGRCVEAERILLKLVKQLHNARDTQGEAAVRINLAYVYIRWGLMSPLAEQCEEAIRLFKADGNKWGEAIATLNLQTYFIAAKLDEKQVWCIRRLLTLSRELGAPRLKLAAYNGIISYYRRQEKYERAEAIGLKTISLAREQGLWEVETINLANLGNVYRDAKRYERAKECYEDSLALGRQRNSDHHVAFAQERLASLEAATGDFVKAMELAKQALQILRRLGNSYREANVEDDLGAWHGELGDDGEAAKSFERAAVAWARTGLNLESANSFVSAISGYTRMRSYGEAARCFQSAWKLFYGKNEYTPALLLLDSLVPVEHSFVILLDLSEVSLQAADLLTREVSRSYMIDAVTALASACKHFSTAIGEPIYQAFLDKLASNGKIDETRAIALAFSIEQAAEGVVDNEGFAGICRNACGFTPDFRYANNGSQEHWTIILPAPGAPAIYFEVLSEAPGVRAAVASIALWLWARRQQVVSAMGRRRWRSLGSGYVMLGAADAGKIGISLPDRLSDKDTPSAVSRRTSYAELEPSKIPAFVHENFLQFTDRLREPNNRCSAFFVGELFVEILREFSQGRVTESIAEEARRKLLCDLFSFRLNDTEKPAHEFPEDKDD